MRTSIHFQRQPRPYGCNCYSLAALCDVPAGWAAEHEADCSTERMQIRLWEHGYALWPVYLHPLAAADRSVWETHVAEAGPQGFECLDYQLAIDSPTYRGVTHAVGLRLYFHDAQVSCAVVVDTSGHDGPQSFGWEEFLGSPYAAARDIRFVWSNELDLWAPVDGPSAPHALDPDAYRREAA